jgi:oxygen-independent coproporphyrinogen-3 oxidase
VYSVFFGGGTPSLFCAASIGRILDAVRARLALDAEVEITLEANPGTFELEKFRGFREAGVNRLSIGVQSFQPGALKALGRVHDAAEARAAVAIQASVRRRLARQEAERMRRDRLEQQVQELGRNGQDEQQDGPEDAHHQPEVHLADPCPKIF